MNKKGFTKTEILIVLGIIGILGVVAGLAVSGARSRTRDAVRLSDVRQVQAGLELYFNDTSTYPEEFALIPLGSAAHICLGESGFAPSCVDTLESVYMNVIGATPRTGLKSLSSCDKASNAYCYLGAENEYRIQFELESGNSLLGLQKGMNCATESELKAGPCLNISISAPAPEVEEAVVEEAEVTE